MYAHREFPRHQTSSQILMVAKGRTDETDFGWEKDGWRSYCDILSQQNTMEV